MKFVSIRVIRGLLFFDCPEVSGCYDLGETDAKATLINSFNFFIRYFLNFYIQCTKA
jgi:hypothetical protein